MFNLDVIVLNLIKKIFDYIFPWSNNELYGFGIYAKLIICTLVFGYVYLVVYKYKKKKSDNKKEETKECPIKSCPFYNILVGHISNIK